jgi:hypothetical protein
MLSVMSSRSSNNSWWQRLTPGRSFSNSSSVNCNPDRFATVCNSASVISFAIFSSNGRILSCSKRIKFSPSQYVGQVLVPNNAVLILFFRNQDFLKLCCQARVYLIEFTGDAFHFDSGQRIEFQIGFSDFRCEIFVPHRGHEGVT